MVKWLSEISSCIKVLIPIPEAIYLKVGVIRQFHFGCTCNSAFSSTVTVFVEVISTFNFRIIHIHENKLLLIVSTRLLFFCSQMCKSVLDGPSRSFVIICSIS